MPPLDQRLADRCTIGAVEKEIFLREIARSECIDAAPIGAVAIDAVALRVVVEQFGDERQPICDYHSVNFRLAYFAS